MSSVNWWPTTAATCPSANHRRSNSDSVSIRHTCSRGAATYWSTRIVSVLGVSVISESYFRRPAGSATLLSVHFAWERLTDSVHRCRLPFCDVTIGLVHGRTGTLLVDTGSTLAEAAAIERDAQQITGGSITHVVLTHKHFDHVLGSSQFTEADIYCAPEVVEYLSSATDQIRHDALHYGADAAEIDRAIAALRPPRRGAYIAIYDAVVNLGNRTATITHPGR